MTQTTLETRTVTIAGREIAVTRISETQAVLINREGILLRKEGVSFERAAAGMNRVLTALESHIVNEEDREFITDGMFAGTIELSDLLAILKVFRDDAPLAAVAAKPAVRRGRPPKNRG